ncbi:MAG: PP2C family protein-serine/threonine phosphatase [Oligoflexia bacterium]
MSSAICVSRAWVEDFPAADQQTENHYVSLPTQGILAVADGLGGSVAGRTAARLACESVVEFLKREAGDREATLPFVLRSYLSLPGNVLFNALIHANRKVLGMNGKKGANQRGAASVVAGYLDRQTLAIASIGGISARLFREGQWTELLIPRTWGRFVDVGWRGAEPWAGRLPLAALGVVSDLEPEVIEFRLKPGDRLEVGTFGAFKADETLLKQDLTSDSSYPEETKLIWEFQ